MAVWFLERRDSPHQPLQVTRLTFDARLALHPAISADGKYVAYASDRGGGGDMHIWVQELPAGDPERLTRDEANEDYPAFSPDGTKIAFRSDRDEGGIYVVSLPGGEPRLLAPQGTRPQYSPDGRDLLFTLRAGHGWTVSPQEFLIPVEGGERRPVQMPVQPGAVNWHRLSLPVFSPDAHQLLCLAQMAATTGSVSTSWYIVPVAGGPITRAEPPEQGAVSSVGYVNNHETPVPLAWLRGNRILYWAPSGDAINLWLATLSARHWHLTKPPDQLTFGPGEITSASVSDSGTIVFASSTAQNRLWSVPLGGGKGQSERDLEVERLAARRTEWQTDLAREHERRRSKYQYADKSGRIARGLHNVPRPAASTTFEPRRRLVQHRHRGIQRRGARESLRELRPTAVLVLQWRNDGFTRTHPGRAKVDWVTHQSNRDRNWTEDCPGGEARHVSVRTRPVAGWAVDCFSGATWSGKRVRTTIRCSR
jgi:dipeptidyl aminopeptidase/acylaminoacyl peptidase